MNDSTRNRDDAERGHGMQDALIHASPVAIVSLDLEQNVTFWNHAAEKLFGWTEQEVLGKPYPCVPPGSEEVFDSYLHKVLKGQPVQDREDWRLRKDGTLVPISVSTAYIYGPDGNICGFVGLITDITERKEAQRALRLSEERFRSLAAATSQIIWTASADGKVLSISEAGLDYSGMSIEDIQDNKWQDVVHPEDRVIAQSAWVKAVTDHTILEGVEYRLRRYDGEYRQFDVRGVPVLEPDGGVREWIGTCQDITKRHEAELALKASEELNRTVLNSLTSQIAVINPDGFIIAANDAWENLARERGWIDTSDMLPVNYLDICRRSKNYRMAHKIRSGVLSVLAGKQAHFTIEFAAHMPGKKQWFALSAYPLPGSCKGAVISRTDITAGTAAERKMATARKIAEHNRAEVEQINLQLENAIQYANELVVNAEKDNHAKTVLLSALPSVLISVGEDGTITQWNRVAEETFGVLSDEAVGKRFDDLGLTWDREAIAQGITDCMAAGCKVRLDDVRFLRQDSRDGFLGITLTPLKSDLDDSPAFLLVGADITDRRHLECQLTQAQKLESIGQLAAGIAHEINTPTQYIGDNTRFLQDSFSDLKDLLVHIEQMTLSFTPRSAADILAELKESMEKADVEYLMTEIPRAIEQSLEGIGRVSRIVRAMKEFSHPGTKEKTSIDINRAIDSTATVASNEWKYVAEIETDFSDELPLVPCLPGDLNQVILNIIVNAAHAIADVVKTDVLNTDVVNKGRISITTRLVDDFAEIRIGDTGTGIPEECRSRVFDPFYTTKDVGKGTGQGLALAHNIIVEKHKGTIDFETEMGKGTTFIIRLPLHDASAGKKEQAA